MNKKKALMTSCLLKRREREPGNQLRRTRSWNWLNSMVLLTNKPFFSRRLIRNSKLRKRNRPTLRLTLLSLRPSFARISQRKDSASTENTVRSLTGNMRFKPKLTKMCNIRLKHVRPSWTVWFVSMVLNARESTPWWSERRQRLPSPPSWRKSTECSRKDTQRCQLKIA